MIPQLTSNGYLPPGIHPATIEEVEKRFGRFDRSDRRPRLFEQLLKFINDARQAGFVKRVVLAGSFVSSKAEPNDFDVVIALNENIAGTTIQPNHYALINHRSASRKYGGDVIVSIENSTKLDNDLAFFGRNRQGESIGLIEILL